MLRPPVGCEAHGQRRSQEFPRDAREQSAERRRCGSPHLKTCLVAAHRDAMTCGVPRPMTLGARLSALHRGICRTPARACVLQDGAHLRAPTALESFTELMLGRRLLVAAGRTGFARVRGCNPAPAGNRSRLRLRCASGKRPRASRDTRAYTPRIDITQEETNHDQRGNSDSALLRPAADHYGVAQRAPVTC